MNEIQKIELEIQNLMNKLVIENKKAHTGLRRTHNVIRPKQFRKEMESLKARWQQAILKANA